MTQWLIYLMALLVTQPLMAIMIHHNVESSSNVYEWVVDNISPFDELVVSWNGLRPVSGEIDIAISIKQDGWTEELPYAVWAANEQKTFKVMAKSENARTNEDTLELLNKRKATGFKVKVEAKDGASLNNFWRLHASFCDVASYREKIASDAAWKGSESIRIPLPGRSQVALDHPRNMHLCSPTSTSAVVTYLAGKNFGAVDFAQKVWDKGHNIYGNWIFNVAEASNCLGKGWSIYMERFDSFDKVYNNLKLGIPTVVSVRGSLPGAIHPYKEGHLIAVIGYDKDQDTILCMDPAYNQDNDTLVSYPRVDFLKACAARGYIAYCFDIANSDMIAYLEAPRGR